MDTKKLMKKLNEANENLKRFSHVNKKALDQYVSFSEQREALLQRKEETDKGEAAIKELIESLDMQKDEVRVVGTVLVSIYFRKFYVGNSVIFYVALRKT